MGIQFQSKEEWFHFYDGKGNRIDRKTEIRFDPLTNESSRIVFDPGLNFTAPDYQEEALSTGGENCPFCKENLLKLTPVFPKEIAEQGRIFKGEAVLFPNLFPYSKHNGVTTFSNEHYVKLADFTTEMIKDAFMAAQIYIQKVIEHDKEAKYASINWNYLPFSGGSILHPHLHIIVSETPMNYQSLVSKAVNNFKMETGQDYFKTLSETEKQQQDRWIGEIGKTTWMHAFAPKTHNDFVAVLSNVTSINDMKEADWLDFAKSLKAIFATLTEQGLASFNMILNFANQLDENTVHARLIPRLTIGQLGTSDINFFQALHQEPLSYKRPEDVAEKARNYFKTK
ncbi:hypothetical protein RJD24_07190 [Bacillaceae bacterium IKA-2]|nr:hypothetical protein RJD24_07190 [Bacillaceae bacterium IKA-2]